MIQFKRGITDSWKKEKTPLAAGQPGYDKERNKLKIGNGKDTWDKLPDASGLRMDEILESEENAKKKAAAKGILNPLGALLAKAFKKEDRPVITYGTETPDEDTIGQIYLQYYDTDPEVDYVIDSGIDDIWTYQIWKSGKAECWGRKSIDIAINQPLDNAGFLFTNNSSNDSQLGYINYPFTFKDASVGVLPPVETVTLSGPKNKLVWLASLDTSTNSTSGLYSIISYSKQESAHYSIMFDVKGYIDKETWKNIT